MIEELYIIRNNKKYRLDLKSPSGITLKFQSNIFGDVSKITASYSYTFKLPMTANNRRLLDNAEDVKNVIVSQCKDGDIILLHDTHEHSVDGAIKAIDVLLEQGYVFVTVDDLLHRYGYDIEKGIPHSSQYAVYETTSPHASEYLEELNSRKAEEEARARAEEESRIAAEAYFNENSEISEENNSSRKNNDVVDSKPQKNEYEEDKYENEDWEESVKQCFINKKDRH